MTAHALREVHRPAVEIGAAGLAYLAAVAWLIIVAARRHPVWAGLALTVLVTGATLAVAAGVLGAPAWPPRHALPAGAGIARATALSLACGVTVIWAGVLIRYLPGRLRERR